MSFANSHVDHIRWCVDIVFPTDPPCYTTIDVLEKGNVPILLSLRQMSNLYFTLRMTPEVTYLTCAAFDLQDEPLQVGKSDHLILDMSQLRYGPQCHVSGRATHCFQSTVFNVDNENEFEPEYAFMRRLSTKTRPEDIPEPPPYVQRMRRDHGQPTDATSETRPPMDLNPDALKPVGE